MEVKKETIGILASFLLALPLLGGGYWVINSLMNQPAITITDQTSPQSIEEPESNVDGTHIFVKDEISITDLDDSYRYNSEEETEAMVLEDTEDTEDNSMEEEVDVSDSIHEDNVGNENQNSSVANSTERTNVRQDKQPVQDKTNNKPATTRPEKNEQKEKTTDSKNKKDDKQTSPPKKEEKVPPEDNKTDSNPKENEEKPTTPSDTNEDNTGSQKPPSTDKGDPTDEPGGGDASEVPEALG
ncbi:hypothetical protein H8S33_02740 [Ornithinibacillus sp. BX22]|uniref:Uncharacterized protein n=1 Tax=Ornithinibacillus hominis TaxID=2763055 RepID=A0A923RG07_9BACI|nr:hypothetical protein [Ornithinibacillus hominis]MBC5635736.1 hypothetical protein [Ornithinibacillus hominis]